MNIVTYRPSRSSLLENWDHIVERFFNDRSLGTSSSTPSVDVREEDGNYLLEAELPGLTEKDVEVKVEENLLTISSKTEKDKEEKQNGYVIRERRSQSYSRSFVLPADVERDKIEASFKNGLLTLSVPKSAAAKPRQIPVKTA